LEGSVISLAQLSADLRLLQEKYFVFLFFYIILAMTWENRARKLINVDIMKLRPGFILQNKLKISVVL